MSVYYLFGIVLIIEGVIMINYDFRLKGVYDLVDLI